MAVVLWACGPPPPPLPSLPDFESSSWAREQVESAYQAAQESPGDADAAGRLGMLLETYRLHGAASQAFARARALDPDDWRWAFCLGLSRTGEGDVEGAIAAYRAARELNPGDTTVLIHLADLLEGQGATEESERLYREAVRRAPESAEAAYGLGSFLASFERCAEAVELLETALSIAPQYGAAYDQLARCGEEIGESRAAAARAKFRQLRGIRPPTESALVREIEGLNRDPTTLREKARLLAGAGHFREAAEEIARSIEIDPESEDSWSVSILIAASRGMWAEALEGYEKALEINPESAQANRAYGVALTRMGATEEALERFRRALEIDPEYHEARVEMGQTLEAQGRLGEALQAYEAVIEAEPRRRLANFYAGRNLLKAGKPAAALPRLEQAVVELDDQTPRMMRVLAGAYSRVGRFEDAVKTAEKALELARDFGDGETAAALAGEIERLKRGEKY